MFFKNFFCFSCLFCLSAVSLTAAGMIKKPQLVAITQITSHPSLDKVREGIVAGLQEEGFDEKKINIIYANAQGNFVLAAQIAQKFVSQHPAAIIGISTPSAQAIAKNIQGTDIPLVFATITDPIGAQIVSSLDKPNKNTTGTRNLPPIEQLIDLISKNFSHLKTIGIPLNYGESNSLKMLEIAEKVAKTAGVKIIPAAASNTTEVISATRSLVNKVQALLLLQDNTVASALPALLQVANSAKIPVFAIFPEATDAGAFLSLATDEFIIGKETGKIVAEILRGKKAKDLPVRTPADCQLKINQKVADSLKISTPKNLQHGLN